MTNITPTAAEIRQRLAYHAAVQASAEARRASLLADRADAIAVLSAGELDEIDDENDHLAIVIERAASRVAALSPALAAAERREAEADAREAQAADNAAFADTCREMMASLAGAPDRAKSAAVAALAASAPVVEYPADFFDLKPAPVMTRVDEKAWHEEREARLRAEGNRTVMEPADAPTREDAGRPSPALSLLR